MSYVRTKTFNGRQYKYLVESYRENGKVKQRVLKYLGAVSSGSKLGTTKQKCSFDKPCDRFRATDEGENFWQTMMKNKNEISRDKFVQNVDASTALDEGETLKDYESYNTDIEYFESEVNGEKVYFWQTAGFEFIFRNKPKKLGTTTNQFERIGDPNIDLPDDLPPSFYKLPKERQHEILMIRESKRRYYGHEVEGQKLTPKERKDYAKAIDRLYEKGLDTKKYHSTKEGKYTKARQELHREIRNDFLLNDETINKKGKPTVIFLGGPPSSGKSEVILKKMGKFTNKDKTEMTIKGEKFIVLDNDKVKSKLPEYREYNSPLTHNEASDIYDDLGDIAILENRNIIFDATLKSTDKAINKIKEFQEKGYDVKVYATNNDVGKSTRGATQRAIKDGRVVPIEYIVKNGQKINVSVQKVAPYSDEWRVYDVSTFNNKTKKYDTPSGEPTILMEGKNKFISDHT